MSAPSTELPVGMAGLRYGITQVSLAVRDLDSTMALYHRACGWAPWQVFDHVLPVHHNTELRGEPGLMYLSDRLECSLIIGQDYQVILGSSRCLTSIRLRDCGRLSQLDAPFPRLETTQSAASRTRSLQSSRGRWWVAGASTSAGRLPRDCPVPKLEVPRIQHALPQLERCLSSAEPLGLHVLRQDLGRHPFPGPHGVEVRELG